MPKVLNVGGGTIRSIPAIFDGWEQHLLDIDAGVKPDIVCDARDMATLEGGQYDGIFTSHFLEHVYKHEVPQVLGGFRHVLKDDGFAYIVVPDINAWVKAYTELDDVWYESASGPITFHDVLYGWHPAMSEGNLFFAHKCGFTERSLGNVLRALFPQVRLQRVGGDLHAIAYKRTPCR